MDFDREHFVSDEAFEEFERGMNVFWNELVRLSTTIFILEKIAEFPFQLFTRSGENIFFNTVFTNSLEAAVLIITRLNDDDGRQAQQHHTFNRFQNRLLPEFIKPAYHKELRERLAQIRVIRNSINESLERLEKIRDNYIAHPDVDHVYGLKLEEPVYLSDLQYLRDKLKNIYGVLALNSVEFSLVPLEYYDKVQYPKGADPRSDIEKILDDIAQQHALLNMPEEQPDYWEIHRQRLTDEEIEQLNHYRQKFGLPTV